MLRKSTNTVLYECRLCSQPPEHGAENGIPTFIAVTADLPH